MNDQTVVGLQFLHSVGEDIVVGSLIIDHLVDQLLGQLVVGSGCDRYLRLFLGLHVRDLLGDSLVKGLAFAFLTVRGAELVGFRPMLRGIDDIVVTMVLEVVGVKALAWAQGVARTVFNTHGHRMPVCTAAETQRCGRERLLARGLAGGGIDFENATGELALENLGDRAEQGAQRVLER